MNPKNNQPSNPLENAAVHYEEVPLEHVIGLFTTSFKIPDHLALLKTEWYIDHIKGVVIYKIYCGPGKGISIVDLAKQ